MAANIIEVIVLGKDQASAVLGKVGGAVSGLGSVAAGVATGGLALAAAAVVGLGAAAVGTAVGITKLTFAAADVEGTRLTFERLTDEFNGSYMAMQDLQAATRGMVGEADLMAASNKFLTMGISENIDETAKMAEMATQLGLAMGEDATASMENFALMMANQSIPRLDSFGISSATVRERIKELTATTEASGMSQADWDEKVGKATQRIEDLKGKLHLAGIKQSEWTEKTKESTRVAHAQRIEKITLQIAEQETELSNLMNTTVGITEASEAMSREEAFKIAVLEQGEIAMKKVGEQGDNAAATTLRWKAAIADLSLGVGQAFIPALEAIRKPVLELVEKYGPEVILWAETAGDWLAEKIPWAIKRLEIAWMEYWPIAQSTLLGFWETIKPKLIRLKGFLFEDIPTAIGKLRALWMEYWPIAQSALMDFWEKIKPGLEWLRDTFQAFTTTYLPHLRAAWGILQEGFRTVSEVYNRELKPALQQLWDALEIGTGKSDEIGGTFGTFMGILVRIQASGVINLIVAGIRAMAWAMETGRHWGIVLRDVLHSMIGAFNNIRHWISIVVDRFNDFRNAISGFQLPWWLTPGSATPLETGLTGIAKTLADVQGLAAGGLAFGGMTLAGASAGLGVGGGGMTTIRIINNFGRDSIRSDEDVLRVADETARSLELRGIGPVL